MDEDEAITIATNQDGCLLSDFKDTLRDLLDGLWFERCTALYRDVDVRDRKFFLASSWYVSEGNSRQRVLGQEPKSAYYSITSLIDPVIPTVADSGCRYL